LLEMHICVNLKELISERKDAFLPDLSSQISLSLYISPLSLCVLTRCDAN